MTTPADLILTNAEVHTLANPDVVHEAVAVRDGRIARVDSAYEIRFLEGVATDVINCKGCIVIPGFIDAHTHLEVVGRYLVHADLRDADSPADVVERLREAAVNGSEEGYVTNGYPDRERGPVESKGIILGYGYDESRWEIPRYITHDDLDEVSTERPVIAFREDMHTASLNTVALERFKEEMSESDVETADGEPTGVVVEGALDPIIEATAPDLHETRHLLRTAQDRANELGVTCVHDMCRNSHKPRVFRELDASGELTLRTRINYWVTHLESAADAGLQSGHGSDMVRVGAIKTYLDGTFGGRTAKLREPYTDVEDDSDGQWVTTPEELAEIVARVDLAGLQFAGHAIGDAAVEAVLDVLAQYDADESRHRVEHAELLTGDLVERFAEVGAVASVQPNFLKWAREDGLYESRIGKRRMEALRFRDLHEKDVPLAFGSDCMPLDPLFGVQEAVTAPVAGQRLSVTEALRAYTHGGAFAAGEEDDLGTVESAKRADLLVLDESPWAVSPDGIADIDVVLTIVDGDIVFDDLTNTVLA